MKKIMMVLALLGSMTLISCAHGRCGHGKMEHSCGCDKEKMKSGKCADCDDKAAAPAAEAKPEAKK